MHPDGKITILCTDQSLLISTPGARIFLIQLQSNGTPDSTFGSNGISTTHAQTFGLINGEVRPFKILLTPSGKLIIAGWCTISGTSKPYHMLVQFQSNGSVDPSFGNNGIAWSKPDSARWLYFSDAMLLPDGKIMTTGRANYTDAPKIASARFNTAGLVDSNFGLGGWTETTVDSAPTCDGAVLALQSTGKFLLGINAGGMDKYSLFVQRFDTNGTLDHTFGQSGTLRESPSDTVCLYSAISKIVMLSSDSFIVAATIVSKNPYEEAENFGFMRLTPNGNVDSQWANSGRIETDFHKSRDILYAATIQPDGKVVAAGKYRGVDNSYNEYPIIVRYKAAPKMPVGLPVIKDNKERLAIYPNPCNGTATIAGTTQAIVALYNGIGQLLQQVKLHAGNAFQHSVSGLVPGVYFVGILGSSTSNFQKLVVVE